MPRRVLSAVGFSHTRLMSATSRLSCCSFWRWVKGAVGLALGCPMRNLCMEELGLVQPFPTTCAPCQQQKWWCPQPNQHNVGIFKVGREVLKDTTMGVAGIWGSQMHFQHSVHVKEQASRSVLGVSHLALPATVPLLALQILSVLQYLLFLLNPSSQSQWWVQTSYRSSPSHVTKT